MPTDQLGRFIARAPHQRIEEWNLLHDLASYFADRADVNDGCGDSGPVPNDAMEWERRIEEVIGK